MVATVAKWGNSLAIRIPQSLARQVCVVEGTEISLSVVDGALVIQPIKQKRYSLEELVEAITPENVHAEIDSGAIVGNEVW